MKLFKFQYIIPTINYNIWLWMDKNQKNDTHQCPHPCVSSVSMKKKKYNSWVAFGVRDGHCFLKTLSLEMGVACSMILYVYRRGFCVWWTDLYNVVRGLEWSAMHANIKNTDAVSKIRVWWRDEVTDALLLPQGTHYQLLAKEYDNRYSIHNHTYVCPTLYPQKNQMYAFTYFCFVWPNIKRTLFQNLLPNIGQLDSDQTNSNDSFLVLLCTTQGIWEMSKSISS